MTFGRRIRPQVILQSPASAVNVIAENIGRGVIPPLHGVASPDLAWDVHGATSVERNYGD